MLNTAQYFCLSIICRYALKYIVDSIEYGSQYYVNYKYKIKIHII